MNNTGSSKPHREWWVNELAMSPGDSLADHGELLWDQTFDCRPVWSKIKAPMLILSPGHSKLVDLDDMKLLHDGVSGSRLEIVDGAGHEINIDQAERCQEL